MTTHSSILAWATPRTEKPDGLQSMGLQRVRQNSVTKHTSPNTHTLLTAVRPVCRYRLRPFTSLLHDLKIPNVWEDYIRILSLNIKLHSDKTVVSTKL